MVPTFSFCHQVVLNFTRFSKSGGAFYHPATLFLNIAMPGYRDQVSGGQGDMSPQLLNNGENNIVCHTNIL